MFIKRNNVIFFIMFVFIMFFGNVDNVKAACTRNDPTLSWVTGPVVSGYEGEELIYTLKITNNNSGGCTASENTFKTIITKPVPNANFNITLTPANAIIGEGANQNITLKLQSTTTGLTTGDYTFSVRVEDISDGTKSATKNDGTYRITELYCAPKNPGLTLGPPTTKTGGAGSALPYTFSVKNNDRTGCTARDFSIELTGLPSCSPNPDWWHDFCGSDVAAPGMCLSPTTTPPKPLYQTGNINAQATKNEDFTITSCTAAALGTYNFTITVKSGTSTSTSGGSYVINALGAEICGNGTNDDGDAYVADCDDPDCLGSAACCGNGTKEGIETCDGNADCGFLEQCVGCSSCVSTVSDGACPINFDDCDCNSLTGVGGCEANLLTNKDNCGVCGNVCPWGCENGACLAPTGGLVPCGRIADNPDTIWNEAESCNLCHVIPLAKNLIDYLLSIVGLIALLSITIGGLLSATSWGGSGGLTAAKMAISKSVTGFVFVLAAWVIVNILMTVFGFIDPMGDGSWKMIDCNISTIPADTSFCGDGIVQETGNGDGVVEKCEQKESKVSFKNRRVASHPECVDSDASCPIGCWAAIDNDCVGVSQEEAWVKSVYSCGATTCKVGCTTDVTPPATFADIGKGCYSPIVKPPKTPSACQKGKYICDATTNEVICADVFSDADYKIAGFSCQPQYDYCCQGSFALFGTLSYDIVRGSGSFYCDDVCKKLGKICIGVGMSGVVCSYTVHNMGGVCSLPGNTASATCQRTFSGGSGFCWDGDSMGYGDTKCYCK